MTVWSTLNLERGTLNFYRKSRSLFDRRPRLVWIKFGHRLSNGRSFCPKIFLIDNAVMVYDESHDSGRPVLRRISNHSETAHHFASHEIIVSAAWSVFALPGEQLVIITVIRHRLPAGALVSFRSGLSHQETEGTWLLTRLGLPI